MLAEHFGSVEALKNATNEKEKSQLNVIFNNLLKGSPLLIIFFYLFIYILKDVEKKFDNINEDKFLRNFKEYITETNKLFNQGKISEFIE